MKNDVSSQVLLNNLKPNDSTGFSEHSRAVFQDIALTLKCNQGFLLGVYFGFHDSQIHQQIRSDPAALVCSNL